MRRRRRDARRNRISMVDDTHDDVRPMTLPDDDAVGMPEDEAIFVPSRPERFNPWLAALASRRIPYRIEFDGGARRIVVAAAYAEKACAELSAYERVNRGWPRPRLEDPQAGRPLVTDGAFFTALGCAALLFRFYLWVEDTPVREWRARGAWRGEAIATGEWWRVITALTLHADAPHVLGNLFWLLGLLAVLGAEIGPGAALAAMVFSGALGNSLMLVLAPEGHAALGASTMVFGLLGVLSAVRTWHTWRTRQGGHGPLLQLVPWVPLLAGMAMLGIYGTAPGSDLLGHGCGFAAGVAIGALLPWCRSALSQRWLQLALAAAAWLLLLAAWQAAFAA